MTMQLDKALIGAMIRVERARIVTMLPTLDSPVDLVAKYNPMPRKSN
jgi:hypothetical protein